MLFILFFIISLLKIVLRSEIIHQSFIQLFNIYAHISLINSEKLKSAKNKITGFIFLEFLDKSLESFEIQEIKSNLSRENTWRREERESGRIL